MGQFERQPDNLGGKGDPYGAAETALRAVTEELQILQRNLLKSLQEDVHRLQAEKDRLSKDITRLQEEKEHLQPGHQINEQQALIRQLSQVLAHHISTQLQSSLETLATQALGGVSQTSTTSENENEYAEKLLGSLDDTLTITFNSLQQELKNYQSSVSQQLSRMSSQQREGEAILIELVNRLRSELEGTTGEQSKAIAQGAVAKPIAQVPFAEIKQTQQQQPTSSGSATKVQTDIPPEVTVLPSSLPQEKIPAWGSVSQNRVSPTETTQSPRAIPEPTSVLSLPTASKPEPQPTANQRLPQTRISSVQLTGVILLVLSTVASALYNVVIKVMFLPGSQIFGVFDIQRLISPTLGNCLFILMLRMLVVVPLMLLLAPMLHSRVWEDLQYVSDSARKNANHPTAKRLLVLSIVSGCFLFLSQILIYLAIGQVATGMAIALFCVYPVISALLSSFLFGDASSGNRVLGNDRLTLFSTGAIAVIGLGELLVLGGSTRTVIGNLPMGSIAALGSGTAFAFYLLVSRKCAAKLHPVSFTLINFATMLLLSIFGLILSLPTNWKVQLNSAHLLELILCAFLLGVLTLLGYLLNNFAIRKIGGSRAAIIGATIPALTVIFAGFLIQETLPIKQVLGVLLVTFGAVTFYSEKIRNQTKPYH